MSCTLQMMFREEIDEAVQFGIDVASDEGNNSARSRIFVLLHRTSFVYGISGDEEQTFTFAHSKEMKTIEKYVDRLRYIGIRMAVTDHVCKLLSPDVRKRYVGYIVDADVKFNLYEILDAYPAKERQGRIDTMAKFNEAINLYYRSDFYFARTLFTEILKECPGDDVAKHYIFRCEGCLNRTDAANGGVFSLF